MGNIVISNHANDIELLFQAVHFSPFGGGDIDRYNFKINAAHSKSYSGREFSISTAMINESLGDTIAKYRISPQLSNDTWSFPAISESNNDLRTGSSPWGNAQWSRNTYIWEKIGSLSPLIMQQRAFGGIPEIQSKDSNGDSSGGCDRSAYNFGIIPDEHSKFAETQEKGGVFLITLCILTVVGAYIGRDKTKNNKPNKSDKNNGRY